MKKNSVLLIVVILLFTLIPVGLSGCLTKVQKEEKKIYETEFFRCIDYYYEYGYGEETVILDLTKKGKEQEILVIPKEINGRRVRRIGGGIKGANAYEGGIFSFESKCVKKVYFDIESLSYSIYNMIIPEAVVVVNIKGEEKQSNEIHSIAKHFVENSQLKKLCFDFDLNMTEWTSREKLDYFVKPNLHYFLKEKCIFSDYIEEDTVYYTPDITKEEGFVGWYTDEALTEEWNGEYVISDGQEELNLYAKLTKAA